jgi:hypothetical protein
MEVAVSTTEHMLSTVKGKDSQGEEIEIDVRALLANDEAVCETFARCLQQHFDKGFAIDQAISVGFIISEIFGKEDATICFPEEQMGTYLPDYTPDEYIPPDARDPV